jgi:hypothetical protein
LFTPYSSVAVAGGRHPVETSPSADARPFGTPPARHQGGSLTRFTWNTVNPPLHTRYRMEWRFRSHPATTAQEGTTP